MELKYVKFVRLLIAYAFRSNWQQIPVKVQIREPVMKYKWRMHSATQFNANLWGWIWVWIALYITLETECVVGIYFLAFRLL